MHAPKQENVFVSVVMCTYNGEKFLSAQMDSILRQTHSYMEVIVCDDASTDHTQRLLLDYAGKDNRIRISINDHTVGIKRNFTNALSLAKGEWIAIADQDDIWIDTKLETLLNCVEDDVLLVHSYNAEFSGKVPEELSINRSRKRFNGNNTRELIFYNTMYGHTMMIKKTLLSHAFPFPEKVFYDWWLGVIASVHGKVVLSKHVLVMHRIHAANFSRHYLRNPDCNQRKSFFENLHEMLGELLLIREMETQDRKLLEEYRMLLSKEWSKKFSYPMFVFLMKHAASAFYYRKKIPMIFYYLKYSYQKATMQIRYWL